MKKNFFSTIALIVVTLASCSKDLEKPTPAPASDTPQVCITLADDTDADTRAFFNDTAVAEAWEKSLSSFTVFAFDMDSDHLILRRGFTAAELTAKTATFALPKSLAGKACAFYAVANYDVPAMQTRAELLALVERAIVDYNGTFAEVSTSAKRSGGFVMTGMNILNIGAGNTTTSVPIRLLRTVAKVAVRTTVDQIFAQKYGGTITVNSVKLSRSASQTRLFYHANLSTGAIDFTHTQVSAMESGVYRSLFYCYENGVLPEGGRVLLEIHATYDFDGNDATTDDRSEVVYPIELMGTDAGQLLRNGYYRIAANITGLAGLDCSVSFTVADWEAPITQTVELGA